MKYVWLILAPAVAMTAGCASASSSPTDQQVGARVLQQFDAANGHGDQPESAYQEELDALGSKCTNSTKDVAQFTENSYNDLVSNGVTDDTALTVLKHLDASVPAGSKMDCQGVLAAYLTLREHGQS